MRALMFFAFMTAINVLLFMTQYTINEVAQGEGVTAPQFVQNNAFMDDYNAGTDGNYTLNTEYTDKLPASSPSLVQNVQAFVFPLQVFLNWLLSIPTFIVAYFTAVPNFLALTGMPQAFVYALGVLWHSIAFWLLLTQVIK